MNIIDVELLEVLVFHQMEIILFGNALKGWKVHQEFWHVMD